jgi:hypothetical protein
MRKLAIMVATAALMAGPALATQTPTIPTIAPATTGNLSIGGGVSEVSGGGGSTSNETSFAGTQSTTSVENGAFDTVTNSGSGSYTPISNADGTAGPSTISGSNSTTDSSGSFGNTSQSDQAFGGESGGGSYSAIAVEGGISGDISGGVASIPTSTTSSSPIDHSPDPVGPGTMGPFMVNGVQNGNSGAF